LIPEIDTSSGFKNGAQLDDDLPAPRPSSRLLTKPPKSIPRSELAAWLMSVFAVERVAFGAIC
jgi:hypothetical protein